jgi:hypothetical protein
MSNEWLLLPDRRCRTLSTLEGLRIDFEADRQDLGLAISGHQAARRALHETVEHSVRQRRMRRSGLRRLRADGA